MLKNYFKIAFRNLGRNKGFTVINILGLSLGICFSVLVLLFIHDELNFDRFHENSENVYRLYRQSIVEGTSFDPDIYMPLPTAEAMKNDFPEVEETVRLIPFGTNIIRMDGTLFEQDNFTFADPSIFDIFTLPFKYGNAASALINPGSVVITEETANKYFWDGNPIGKTLSIRLNSIFSDFVVTGVLENLPANSTIQFSVLLSTEDLLNRFDVYSGAENRWDATRTITYILLRKGSNVESLRDKLPQFMNTHMGDIFNEMRENGNLTTAGAPIVYQFQPLSDIHLNPEIPGGFSEPSNPTYSYILGGIALTVLLIACFNFMILSISQSTKRAKEVGLRKVAGAVRSQLMAQFWAEAILVTFISLLFGLFFAEFFLPVFNELSGKTLSFFPALNSFKMLFVTGGLLIITGLIAGSYPALILSNYKPIDSLKNKITVGGANPLSKSLIMVQFALSIFLVAATLGMSNQLKFLQSKSLGFSGEQVVVIPVNGVDGQRALNLYRDALGRDTDIVDMSGANVSFATGLWRRGYRYGGELIQSAVFRVDPNYINTLEMNIVTGRNFNPELASDSTQSIIVNETFLERHSLDYSDVGQVFPIDWGWMTNPVVIGVVEDFNYQSLQNNIEPAIMYMNPRDPILNLMVRIKPDNIPETIDKLQATWAAITNEVPFSYSFLDEDMDNLYRAEERWSTIITYSSIFAIFVACLGLFGLTGIISIQRQKEIGIRKVLGASIQGIILLLSKDFAKLILISIIIASPLAWLALNKWLQNFAYRTDPGIGIFLIAGGFALAVALATVSWQSLKAAFMNPVESLRSE
tara:strand:+ start:3556 stop:5988 length:2433 start_codon:yes stop_codon:yes gene_type:complete